MSTHNFPDNMYEWGQKMNSQKGLIAHIKERQALKNSIVKVKLYDAIETSKSLIVRASFKNDFKTLEDFILKAEVDDGIKEILLEQLEQQQNFVNGIVKDIITGIELADNVKKTFLDQFEEQQDLLELLKNLITIGMFEDDVKKRLLDQIEKQQHVVGNGLKDFIARRALFDHIENREDSIQKNLKNLADLMVQKAPKEHINDHVEKINRAFQESIKDLHALGQWKNIYVLW